MNIWSWQTTDETGRAAFHKHAVPKVLVLPSVHKASVRASSHGYVKILTSCFRFVTKENLKNGGRSVCWGLGLEVEGCWFRTWCGQNQGARENLPEHLEKGTEPTMSWQLIQEWTVLSTFMPNGSDNSASHATLMLPFFWSFRSPRKTDMFLGLWLHKSTSKLQPVSFLVEQHQESTLPFKNVHFCYPAIKKH